MTANISNKPQAVFQGNINSPMMAMPVLHNLPTECRIMKTLQKKVESLANAIRETKQSGIKLEQEWEGWPKDFRYTNALKDIRAQDTKMKSKLNQIKEICNLIRDAGFVALDIEVDLVFLSYKLNKR